MTLGYNSMGIKCDRRLQNNIINSRLLQNNTIFMKCGMHSFFMFNCMNAHDSQPITLFSF